MGFGDTTLALPPELKEQIRALKLIPEETFPNVLRRLIKDSEKVPELEKRIVELEAENAKLKEENESLEWAETEARLGDEF